MSTKFSYRLLSIIALGVIATIPLRLPAQLLGTQWKGTLRLETPMNVILDFGKDSMVIYNLADHHLIEISNYRIAGNEIILSKISGESDCSTSDTASYFFTTRKDYLLLKVRFDDCNDRSSVLDTSTWSSWVVPTGIAVEPEILKSYCGTYGLDAGHPIIVTFEQGTLMVEGPHNQLPRSPLIAKSESVFFLKISGSTLEFIKDNTGKVNTLISHEAKDYTLKRIK